MARAYMFRSGTLPFLWYRFARCGAQNDTTSNGEKQSERRRKAAINLK